MLSLFAAIAIAAAPPLANTSPELIPPPQPLTAAQSQALRCGVVFARAARMQAAGDPQAKGWPPLGTRGREFFVRVGAAIMAETGATRDALERMAAARTTTLADDGAVAAAMPGCLTLLDASGV